LQESESLLKERVLELEILVQENEKRNSEKMDSLFKQFEEFKKSLK